MKKLKIIVSILLLVLVVILSGELYQQYLGNFTNQFYYFSVNNEGDRNNLLSQILTSCQDNGIDVFAYKSSVLSQKNNNITIYATSPMVQLFKDEYNISEGQHSSLFSGDTNIIIKDFSDCLDSNIDSFYFTGTMGQVLAVKADVTENFGTSYVHSDSKVGNEWLVYVIWGVAFVVILLLTWFDIEFSKKEMFVRFSMGASRRMTVLRNILTDSALLVIIFYSITCIYESQFNVGYNKTIVSMIFGTFLILNSVLHCTLFGRNYKQIIYGANISSKMLSNCYVLKSLSLIIAILSLSVNIQLICSNSKYMQMYDYIDQYEDYSFLSVEIDTSNAETVLEKIKLNDAITNNVFCDLYFQDKVALASYAASDDNDNPFVVINKNTQGAQWVKELIQNEDGASVYILVPSRMNQKEIVDFAIESASKLLGDYTQSTFIKTIVYDNTESIFFFESDSSTLHPYGFDKEEQPLVIYLDLTYNESYSTSESNVTNMTVMWSDIMFKISEADIASLTEKYDEIIGISSISVIERCDEYRYMFIRIVALNTIISIFMILLELVIVTTIIRMEYIVNAKEYTVKKILGYSVWQKNKMLFLLNLFSAGIGLFSTVCLSLMFDITAWYFNVIATLLFIGIELVLMICYSRKTENSSVQKVLKGGGL